MDLLTFDFETFWDADYTLSKMSTEAYVRDPRFYAHLVGLQLNDRPAVWVPHDSIPNIFARIDWNNTIALAQHAHFDGLILSHHYGVQPAMFADTLSMFRALYPAESASLANQAKVLGLPAKGAGYDIINTKGIQRLNQQQLNACGAYCILDCEITRKGFNLMRSMFPLSELRLISLIVKLFTEPVLLLNKDVLQEAYDDEQQRLVKLLTAVFPDRAGDVWAAIINGDPDALASIKKPLASNPQFAQILYNLGVDPPKKLSPAAVTKGIANPDIDIDPPIGLLEPLDKKTLEAFRAVAEYPHPSEIWSYAFSKSDEVFKQLLEHDDDTIRSLVEARFGVKSTIKETRAKAFMGISERGPFPIYLKYFGGHTGRLAGGDRVNPQNLNRSCPHCEGEKCPKCEETGVSPMRRAIEAPPGYMVIVRDLSAIEARVNFWLAGQTDKIEAYRRGVDLYCLAASEVFGRTITKKEKQERFLGKSQILGCGYGLGWKKYQAMLRIGMLGNKGLLLGDDIAVSLGVSGQNFAFKNSGYINESLPPGGDVIAHATHCACSAQIIKMFRDNNPMVPEFWQLCQRALERMFMHQSGVLGPNGVIGYDYRGWMLPNGMRINYVEINRKEIGRRYEYSILKNRRKGERTRIYGGKCMENLTQGLARIILTDAMLRMQSERIRVIHNVHDEILAIAPVSLAEGTYHRMGEIMAQPPAWAPDLPLASEGGYARQYIK